MKLIGQKTNRAGHRRPDQGRHGRRPPADDPPARLLGQQLGGQPAPADHRPGQGRPGCVALEIHWPTSGTTQVFRDIAADQAIEVTEFAKDYRKLDWKPVPRPEIELGAASITYPSLAKSRDCAAWAKSMLSRGG